MSGPPSRRWHGAGPEYLGAGIRRQRMTVVETLRQVAARLPQELALARCFHALRHHLDAKLVAHGDHGIHDGRLARILGDAGHEALVHLDGADGETTEIAQ